jgi:radical SAM superfamily enzyme YgiQ (UPF0313 family)
VKVLLIAPTALNGQGRPIKQRRLHLPALTLAMLAGATPAGIDQRLVFETVEDIPFHEHWDLVGLTGMGSGIVRAWQIADEFRNRGAKVVIGGLAASLGKLEWSLDHADAVVLGEAEDVWPQVVRDAEANRLQSVYRMSNRPAIDRLPVPRYDLMNRSKLGFWRPVQATRGCPFPCSFCSITSFFGGTYRKRPVDQVVRDVREAKRHGSPHIAFIDDNIGVDFDYCGELWEALIPEKIVWMSQCSLHITERPDLMRLAHRSGCRVLSFGIESTNVQSLQTVEKEWNRPERYRSAFEALRKCGIEVSTEMVVGLDGDDASVFQRTFEFIMENRIPVPRLHIITPIPGTPLYEKLEGEGRILLDDFSRYTGGKAVFRPMHFRPEDLEKGYWALYERLFSWPSILRRVLPNRASLGAYMRAVIWIVNVKYRRHIHHRISPGIL